MIKLVNDDCLNYLANVKDHSIDMILCDLPYGTTDAKWDNKLDLSLLFKHYDRIIKDNGVVALFNQEPFGDELRHATTKALKFRYNWVWAKSSAVGFLHSHHMPLRSFENISIFYKKMSLYNPQFTYGKPYKKINKNKNTELYHFKDKDFFSSNEDGRRYPRDILYFNNVIKPRYHSTQKPVDLLSYLIRTYTNEGDTILDNCMGSGSTGVAAVKNNRSFIGIELESKYYQIAKERINKEEENE